MKSSCSKEDVRKKHASCSSPDTAKCPKTSMDGTQYAESWHQRKNIDLADVCNSINKSDKTNLKTLENLSLHHSIKPCPFTFLTAVKQKLALGDQATCKKIFEIEQQEELSKDKMDFIKPLKVPDLKISSKADYSSRESLLSTEELSKKIEAVQRDEMTLKCSSRPRKLEFSSSSGTSLLNFENIEPLTVSDMVVSKKKDLFRDSSREKENRSKRVKKDDIQDISKWPKSQRHISRKEIADSVVNKKLQSDHVLAHGPKHSEAIFKKLKTKDFTSSTLRKDDEKRRRHSNIPSAKSKKDKSIESKSRTSSNDSIYSLDKGTRLHEKILIREGYKAMLSEINHKSVDDNSVINSTKQSEEQRPKSHSETRLSKHQNKSNATKSIQSLTRDQNKRILDKQKSSNRTDSKHSSEISEDLSTAATSIANHLKNHSFGSESSSIPSKSKSDKFSPSHSSNRILEEIKQSDTFSHISSSNSLSNSTIIETKLSQDSSLSEKLLDPNRISFRDDSYSNQPEFADLVPPDMNLIIRSKRRKQALQERDSDNSHKQLKQVSSKSGQDIEEAKLMQLKTEVNLIGSISESLRQVTDNENSRLSSDDLQIHSVSMESDEKDSDSKKSEFGTLLNKESSRNKIQKPLVKVVEMQTQTANDIATQTDSVLCERGINAGLVYSKVIGHPNELQHVSLNSEDKYEDMDRVEDISLQSKMRTMSEISLHETTSSIKTETGTEISISTRDVTCSFTKYLDLEMAQLIKDERQRYDKIEMLFKSREKTLNDRTKKLVKLEEQKRALRDTGQDSRISSVKKKQRALLLKLQQEKDEMNRLKELHKIASQERKLMLQKQRDMFNPEMSTKNILNKLKRSADSQSPRRLSGPMKGYDIRSNSSISSLVDSDKSQFDRSHLNVSEITPQKNDQPCPRSNLTLKQDLHGVDNSNKRFSKLESNKQQKESTTAKLKYDLKSRKFEEKMPKFNLLKLKSQQPHNLDASMKHDIDAVSLLNDENCKSLSQDEDKSSSEHIKSESDALIDEFTQMWKSQFPDFPSESLNLFEGSDSMEAFKELQKASSAKRLDKESLKKSLQQCVAVDCKNAKRKGAKVQKLKADPVLKSEISHLEDAFHNYNKRTKVDSEQQSDDNCPNSILEELDFNESHSSLQALLRHSNLLKERNQYLLQDIADKRNDILADNSESPLSQKDEEDTRKVGNTSARSQLSLTISHQSSNDSDRSFSRSVVIRSQQDQQHHHPHQHHHHQHQSTGLKTSKKLEQILRAREATLVSRRNCVDEWIAWHARLREEENRVARMEQAAYKLVSATAKALSHNDTTVSSDTSDVEGRIELLTQKLADRRLEMVRLKKEARKQAKQRLRSLEANLLNQIKKYDATIHDMRKKLESKRETNKENEKLAIESKSIIDFKVPEIPIKKIQEIYKSSDLLKSKSDSELISSKSERKSEESGDIESNINDIDKSSSRSKNTGDILSSLVIEEHESSDKSENSAVLSYKTKTNSEKVSDQKSIVTDLQETKRSSSQSSNISEEIPSEVNSVKSQSGQILSTQNSLASQYIEIELSKNDMKYGSNFEEELTAGSDDTSLIFSRKLDHIQLNNKELNEDIQNLESDLRELTEMMSNFSKTSEKKSESVNLSNNTFSKVSEKNNINDNSEKLLGSEINTEIDNDDLQSRVNQILSDVIPKTDDLLTSIEEFDYGTKGPEILIKEGSTLSELADKSEINEEIITDVLPDDLDNKTETSLGANHNDAQREDKNDSETTPIPTETSHHIIPEISEAHTSLPIETASEIEFKKIDNLEIQEDNTELASTSKKSDEVDLHIVPSVKIDTINEDISMDTNISEQDVISDVENFKIDKKENIEDHIDFSIDNKLIKNKISVDDVNDSSFKENVQPSVSFVPTAASNDNDWTLSGSFEVHPLEEAEARTAKLQNYKDEDKNGFSDMENSGMFVPKGESTNIQETFMLKLDESSDPRIGIRSEEFNDILEIIERETKNDEELPEVEALKSEVNDTQRKIDIKLNGEIQCDVSVTIATVDEQSESISEEIESKHELTTSEDIMNEEHSVEDLPQIEIGVKIDLIDEDNENSNTDSKEVSATKAAEVQISEVAESSGEDRGSSDGEQLDNLIEVTEGKLATVEKLTPFKDKVVENVENENIKEKAKTCVKVYLDRTFEVIKDPEYEDISEESMEVSDILDRSESYDHRKSKKFITIPEKYVIKSQSDEVLRILDEISNKSNGSLKKDCRDAKLSETSCVKSTEQENDNKVVTSKDAIPSPIESNHLKDICTDTKDTDKTQNNSAEEIPKEELIIPEIVTSIAEEEDVQQEDSQKIASESSGLDTPRGVSEIDIDSPRDVSDNSRLDVDALDDDLLAGNALMQGSPTNEMKTEFRTTPMGVTSEKDIEAMIEKLKASLEQPGLEVAELEAKLLQIENLQIELKIKRLEAEAVTYYVREIPNKPPPPYTPPGAVRLSGSPSPPPAVAPSNVDELTAITEKATSLIYQAKQAGEDVLALKPPSEICEIGCGTGDALQKDRRIYNGFLFDLCKELVVEMYKAEQESPGPSWTKPSVKTKPTVKVPRTLDELNEYVSKEAATLFGFKTRLQRENMVMRWSRKRRDRVDELLAKEAQAEEKEWTKFHHDELAVKNELTITILDSLITETTSCIKAAYAKKRKVIKA